MLSNNTVNDDLLKEKNYSDITYVGNGAYGIVYKCRNKLDQLVAVKIIDVFNHIEMNNGLNEAIRLIKLNHKNIVKVYNVFFLSLNKFAIEMEYLNYGNLFDMIYKNNIKLSETLIIKIIKQTCDVLQLFEENEIIHRDIKLNNILIKHFDLNKEEIEIVFIDFGNIKLINDEQSMSLKGTIGYFAPELLLNNDSYKKYSYKTDIFAAGVCLYKLMSFDFITDICQLYHNYENNDKLVKEKLINNIKKNYSNYSDELIELILHMLERDVNNRYSVKQMLNEINKFKEQDIDQVKEQQININNQLSNDIVNQPFRLNKPFLYLPNLGISHYSNQFINYKSLNSNIYKSNNPSFCIIEDFPSTFIDNNTYKLKLQLKGEKGNILKGGYLIKSFLFNNESTVRECNIIDNNDGTYFIEFKCPSDFQFLKLKTFIEMNSYELNTINFSDYSEIINNLKTNVLIENQFTKFKLQLKTNDGNYFEDCSNLKIESFITDLNNDKISQCILQNNNNNGTFTIEFKIPTVNYNEILLHCLIEDKPVQKSPLKFTIVKPEINIFSDTELKYNELNNFILQFKDYNNQLIKIENIKIESFIHLQQFDYNDILFNCNIVNNYNGTFNIQFNTPIENKNNLIYLSIKINDQLLNNTQFIFSPNYGISFSNEFIYCKTIGNDEGSDNGQFICPADIKIDEKDKLIFVTDSRNHRIQVFDFNGMYQYGIKTPLLPLFIAIDYFRNGKEILVGCYDDQKIYRFEKKENGKQLNEIIGVVDEESENYQFDVTCGGIIIDEKNGNIYISDNSNNRIKIYSNSGQLLKIITNNELQYPRQLDFNSKNQLVVANKNSITVFDLEGKLISVIKHENYTKAPFALVVDKTNDNIIINYNNDFISVFDKNGKFITEFGKEGRGIGEFNGINALALDSNGQLYVLDCFNHRIQIFK